MITQRLRLLLCQKPLKERTLVILVVVIFNSCNTKVDSIKFFRIIENKSYKLDSVVMYKNNRRHYIYNDTIKYDIKNEIIQFGSEDSLISTALNYVNRNVDDTTTELIVRKVKYIIDKDSIYFINRGKLHSRRIIFSTDSSLMEIHQNVLGWKDILYYSIIRNEQ